MVLGIFGILACVAAIVLFGIALFKKSGWGLVRAGAIFTIGLILFIVGVATSSEPESTSPAEVPTPTQNSQVGKSLNNPVPFGTSLTYGDQRLTILGSERLTGIGWTNPEAGKVYLAVKLKVDFLGERIEKRQYLHGSTLRVTGRSGHIYDAKWYPETDTPLKTGEFYGGSSTSGDLVYEIDETEANLILIWNCGLGVDRYFEIP